MIYLHTLGDCLIKVGEKEIRPTSPLIFAALLYLGMERGRRVPRAALQELFFPNVDERSGAHSVRQLLYKLRQLGVLIDVDSGSVELEAAQVRSDVDNICDVVARAPDRAVLGFLPSCSYPTLDVFGDWIENCRARVAAELRRAFVERVRFFRNAANWHEAERYSRHLLQVDPLHEEGTLVVAEALAAQGSKATALRLLDEYNNSTDTHLRVSTSLLRRRISESPSDHQQSLRHTPFVGRDDEVRRLRHEVTSSHHSRIILLVGEAGIGKTRLIEETLRLLAFDGISVFTVRCKPYHASRPAGVMIELTPLLLEAPGALGIAPEALQHLRWLLNAPQGSAEQLRNALDDATRAHCIEASFADLLDAVASERPTLVTLEDVHWCDLPSLQQIVRSINNVDLPISLLMSCRPLDADRRRTLTECDPHIYRVGPLDRDAIYTLAQHLLRQPSVKVDLPSIEWYADTAAGNPLFLQMLCADYAATLRPYRIPPVLESAISGRIAKLSPIQRRILQFTALLGRHAAPTAVRALSECSSAAMLDAVEVLEDEGFLRLSSGVLCVHELVGDRALAEMGQASLALLHDRVGQHLSSEYDRTHDAGTLWDCAEHWAHSGDAAKAMDFLLRCARHALGIGQARHAAEILARADKLATDPRMLAQVLVETMLVGRSLDDWSIVVAAANRLRLVQVDTISGHGVHELLLIEAAWENGTSPQTSIPTLTACARDSSASVEHRLQAAHLLLRVAHEYAAPGIAHELYKSVEPLIRQHYSHTAATLELIYHTSFGNYSTAVTIAKRFSASAMSWPTLVERMQSALNAGAAFSFLGLCEESDAAYMRCFEEAKRLDIKEWQLAVAVQSCWACVSREDYTKAAVWLEHFESILAGGEPPTRRIMQYLACKAELELSDGDVKAALVTLSLFMQHVFNNSIRAGAYAQTLPVRIRMHDPSYLCSPDELEQLRAAYESARDSMNVDYLSITLAEAYRRLGQTTTAVQVVQDYLRSHRRERSPLPRSLQNLVRQLGVSIDDAPDSVAESPAA